MPFAYNATTSFYALANSKEAMATERLLSKCKQSARTPCVLVPRFEARKGALRRWRCLSAWSDFVCISSLRPAVCIPRRGLDAQSCLVYVALLKRVRLLCMYKQPAGAPCVLAPRFGRTKLPCVCGVA